MGSDGLGKRGGADVADRRSAVTQQLSETSPEAARAVGQVPVQRLAGR
jgi:hypothetical protein